MIRLAEEQGDDRMRASYVQLRDSIAADVQAGGLTLRLGGLEAVRRLLVPSIVLISAVEAAALAI